MSKTAMRRTALGVATLILALAVGCGGPPAGVGEKSDIFLVDKAEINLRHVIDHTSCPGPPGALTITNNGKNRMLWDLNGAPGWLDVDRPSGTFDPEERSVIYFSYNCSRNRPGKLSAIVFITMVDFTAGAVVGTRPIFVTVVVEQGGHVAVNTGV
ncbi:MAG: hypothetical protein OEZ32_14525 [Nitrospinota bacterium]|nr:hypothetical protein [Nitrospinota bacterium]